MQCNTNKQSGLSLLGGALLGAAVMYLLDPESGKERREHLGERTGDALGATGEALETVWDRSKAAAAVLAAKAAGAAHDVRDSDAVHNLGSRLTGLAHDVWDKARHAGHGVSDRAAALSAGAAAATSDWTDDWSDRARDLSHEARHRLAKSIDPDHVHRHRGSATGYTATGLGTLLVGAGLMYFLDPARGRGRRAQFGQQATKILRDTGTAARRTGRDVMNRVRGSAYEARGLVPLGREADTDGERLLQRVRSELGHVLTYPTQVQLMADAGGAVTLYGRVPASEVDRMLSTVHAVRGVNRIVNRVEVCNTLGAVTGTGGVGSAGTGAGSTSGSLSGGATSAPGFGVTAGQSAPQL